MRRCHLISIALICATSLGFPPVPAIAAERADSQLAKAEARGRQLTAWFAAGNVDSLLPVLRAFDLAVAGDTVVARWVREPGSPVPSNWPEAPANLHGREGLQQVIEHARSKFGRESTLVDEASYQNLRSAGHTEYFRISHFSGYESGTVTMNWAMDRRGSSLGGFIMPTPEVETSEYDNYEPKTHLRLPFDGEWTVLQGGRRAHENDQLFQTPLRFACDFVVTKNGLSFSGRGTRNSDHFAYGLPIVAPGSGRVIAAVDTFPENTPLHPPPGHRPGNFVVIDHGNSEYSVLAHLKRGSMRVARGDSVTIGQKIGECGNNGFSTEPHLHYQLQIMPRPGGPVVPTVFHDYWVGGVFVERGEPRKGEHIRAK